MTYHSTARHGTSLMCAAVSPLPPVAVALLPHQQADTAFSSRQQLQPLITQSELRTASSSMLGLALPCTTPEGGSRHAADATTPSSSHHTTGAGGGGGGSGGNSRFSRMQGFGGSSSALATAAGGGGVGRRASIGGGGAMGGHRKSTLGAVLEAHAADEHAVDQHEQVWFGRRVCVCVKSVCGCV